MPHAADLDTLGELEAQCLTANDWRQLVDLYESNEELASEVPDYWNRLIEGLRSISGEVQGPEERSLLLVATGEVWRDRLGDPEHALVDFRESFRTWHENKKALRHALAIYREQGRWDMVLRFLMFDLEHTKDPSEQAGILRRIGDVQLQLGRPDRAIERLELAASLEPDASGLAELMERAEQALAETSSIPDDGPEDFEHFEIDLMPPPETDSGGGEAEDGEAVEAADAADAIDVAQTAETEAHVHEPGETDLHAAETAETVAHTAETAETEAHEGGADVASAGDGEELPPPVDGDEWEEEAEPAVDADLPDDPADAIAELTRRLDECDQLDDRVTLLRAVLSREPTHWDASIELADCLAESGADDESVEVLEALAHANVGSPRGPEATALAWLAAVRSGHEEATLEAVNGALDSDPTDEASLRFMRAYHTEREQWSELRDVYQAALEKKKRWEKSFDLATELADLKWRYLGEEKEAEIHFKRLRLSDPKNPRMLAFYADFHRRNGDFKRLLNTLKGMRSQEQDPERWLATALEMAALAEGELAQPERAIDEWKVIAQRRPDNEQAAKALRRLYTESGKFNALLEYLKGQLLVTPETERKVAILFEVADVYRERLGLEAMEVNTLAEVLHVSPGQPRATEILVGRYEAAGEWEALFSALQGRADHTDDAVEEVRLRQRLATLARDQLGDVLRAVPHLERLVELHPEDSATLEALRAIYTARGDHRLLLRVLQREAENLEGDAQVVKLEDAAELAWESLGDVEGTVAVAQRLLVATERTSARALALLEEIYRGQSAWSELVPVLDARRDLLEVGPERKTVLVQTGDIQAAHLKDPDGALASYQGALEIDDSDALVVNRIETLFADFGRWDELEEFAGGPGSWPMVCRLLQDAIPAAEPAEQIELLRRIARVAADQLGDEDTAIVALETILQRDPADAASASALVPYYEAREQYSDLARVLAVLAAQAEGGEATGLAARISGLYEGPLENLSTAADWAGFALESSPDDEERRAETERLARATGREAWAVDLFQRVAEHIEGDDQSRVLRATADLVFDALRSSHAEVATSLYASLANDESHADAALVALETLHREAAHHSDLLEVLGQRAERCSDSEEQTSIRLRIAAVQGEHLGDLASAIETYRAVLSDEPKHGEALQLLKAAQASLGDWDAVIETLGVIRDNNPEARAGALLELGEVALDHLNDPDQALETFTVLLSESPGSDETGQAVTRLIELLELPDQRMSAAALLEGAYEHREQWTELAGARELLVAEGEEDERRLHRLRDLSEVYERHLDDPIRAFSAALRLCDQAPEGERGWDEIERFAGSLGNWRPVISFYGRAGQAHPENLDLVRRLARALQNKAGDMAGALPLWERVWSEKPGDAESGDALEVVYAELGRREVLKTHLLARVSHSESDGEAKANLFKICAVLEQDGTPLEAIRYYQRVIDIDEADTRAFEALRVLLDSAQDWKALAALLRDRLLVCPPEDLATLRLQLGSIREGSINDMVGAVEMYRAVLEDDHSAQVAAHGMERVARAVIDREDLVGVRQEVYDVLSGVYREESDWASLVRLYELQISDPTKAAEQAGYYTQVGRLRRDELGQQWEALESFANAVRMDYADEKLRTETEALAGEIGGWERMVILYEHGLEICEPGAVRTGLARRLAQLQHQELGDASSAITYYDIVVENDPDDRESIDVLEGLYEDAGRLDRLVAVRRLKAQLLSGEERTALMRSNARTLRDDLLDPTGAADAYAQILEEHPGDEECLEVLEDLYGQLENWAGLVNVLTERVPLTEAADERRELHVRMGAVCRDQLGQASEAIDAYRAAHALASGDAAILFALEGLYREEERWADLAEILHKQRALSDAPELRDEIGLRLAKLHHRKLEDAATAIALYREVLETDPQQPDAVEALEELAATAPEAIAALLPAYEATDRWEDVKRLLELRLTGESEMDAQLHSLGRIVEVCEGPLGDNARALDGAARRYRLSPEEDARTEMERLAAAAGDFESVAGSYQAVLDGLSEGEDRVPVLVRLGSVYRDRLQRLEDGERVFAEAVELAPEDLGVLDALEQLYRVLDRPDDVMRTLSKRIALALAAGDTPLAVECLAERARIEEQSDQPAVAVETARQVVGLDPVNDWAHRTLDRLYRAGQQWADVAELFTARIEHGAESEQLAWLHHELSRVYWKELDQPELALEQMTAAVSVMPAAPEVILSLEELLEGHRDGALAAPIAAVLASQYEAQGAWPKLPPVLDVQAEAAEPADAAGFYSRSAELLQERLLNPEGAFERWEQAVQLDASRLSDWRRLYSLAGGLDRWEVLSEHLRHALEDESLEEGAGVDLSIVLGELQLDALGDRDAAQETFEDLLKRAPHNEDAVAWLERIYTREADWMALAGLYQRQLVDLSDPERQLQLLLRTGRLFDGVLADAEEAIGAYDQVLQLDDACGEAYQALERLYEFELRHQELARLLERRAAIIDDAGSRAEVLLRLGETLSRELGERERAVQCYEDVLTARPGDAAALTALEFILQVLRARGEEPDLRTYVVGILEEAYDPNRDWRKLVGLQEARLETLVDAQQRSETLRLAARLSEEQGANTSQAFTFYCRAFVENPNDRDTLAHLERLAEVTQDFEGLADAFIGGLPNADDTELAVSLLMQTSKVCIERLRDRTRAIAVLERILDLDPQQRGALDELEALLKEGNDHGRLVKVLLRRAEQSEDLLDQKEFCFQAAEIQENVLENLEAAAATYRRILDLDTEDIVALEQLERILRRTREYAELVNILLTKTEIIDNDQERRKLYLEMAEVYEKELDDIDSAVDVYRYLRSEDPSDVGSLKALDRLFEQAERWADLLDTIELQRKFAEEEDELDRLDFRTATLLEQAMEDVPRAIEVYRSILQRNPESAPALSALEALVQGEQGKAAGEVLDAHYRRAGDWSRVIGLLEGRVSQASDRATKHGHLREMARIYEAQMGQPTLAFREMSRAFSEKPTDDELFDELSRVAGSQDMWDALANLLDELSDEFPEHARTMLLRSARIHERDLGHSSEAADRYRRVLAAHASDRTALEALDTLYTTESDWESLASILQQRIDVAEGPAQAANFRFRLAYIIESVFSDEPKAIQLYLELLGQDEPDERVIESLERLVRNEVHNPTIRPALGKLYRARQQWTRLAELNEASLPYAPDAGARAELLSDLAEVANRQEQDTAKALGYIQRALQETPEAAALYERLWDLSQEAGAWSQYAELLESVRPGIQDPERRATVTRQLAQVYETHLDDVPSAEANYRDLLTLVPDDESPLLALQAIYERTNQDGALATTLMERSERPNAEDAGSLLSRVVELAEGSIGDPGLAAEAHRRLHVLDPEAPGPVVALVRLYEQVGDVPRLVDMLEKQANHTEDPAARDQILRKIGRLAQDELQDPARAARAYGQALDRAPDDLTLHRLLAPIYKALEDWDALNRLLQLRLKLPSSEDDRVEVTHQLAELQLGFYGDTEAAAELYRRGLESSPKSELLLTELARLLREGEHWEELVGIYRRLEEVLLAATDQPKEGLLRLYMDLSVVEREMLGDEAAAIGTLRRLLAFDEDNLPALAELGRLLEDQSAWDEALEVVGREIGLCTEPVQVATLYYRQADILRNMGAEEVAVKTSLEQALRLDQSRVDVAEELKVIYEALEDWEALWAVGSLLANREADPAERKTRALFLAEVARDRLNDSERLTKALEVAYVLDQQDIEVVEALAMAYIDESAFDKAGPLIDRLLAEQGSETKARARAQLQSLKGRVMQGLGEQAHAEAAYRAAYQLDPAYLPNLMSLGQLLFAMGNLDESLKFFQMMLLHQMSLKDKSQRVTIHYQMGEIYRLKGDRRRARDLYMRALSIDRNHEPSKEALNQVQ